MTTDFDKDSFRKVVKASQNDIKEMLELNYKIYPEEWHVSQEYVRRIMERNPEVYNILMTNEGIKGIFSLFPLSKDTYEEVLSGSLEESDLSTYLLNYKESKEVYLYLISLIVDIHDAERKEYAKQLIQGIPKELKRLLASGIQIKEIGAIAISPEGENVLPKIGFQYEKEMVSGNKKYPVFRATVENVLNSIQL